VATGATESIGAQLQRRADAVRQRVEISSVIGRDMRLRKIGRELTALCPFHAEKRDGTFMVNDDKGLYHCFGCGAHGDVIDYVIARKGGAFIDVLKELEAGAGIDFRDARQRAEFDAERDKRERQSRADERRRRANAKNFWVKATPGKGTPAQFYLEARGIDFARLGKFPGAIRFRMDAYCAEVKKPLPAMATAIYALDGTFLATHRTYLEYRRGVWGKAPLAKPKMVLGSFYGGSMPLWKGDSAASLAQMPPGQGMALGEGIEDTLTVAMDVPDLRAYAAVSLDNIGNVALPEQAGDLTILGQRDGDVREALAAKALAAGDAEGARHHEQCAIDIKRALERAIGKQQDQARRQGSGRAALIAWPDPGFKDFNDQLRGIRMEGA
jgi:hypothetical protein